MTFFPANQRSRFVAAGQEQLVEVFRALDAVGGLAQLLHRRQQAWDESDNGDYHQLELALIPTIFCVTIPLAPALYCREQRNPFLCR